jgi:transcriptional regulator with XRE-family HTH domain
MARGVPHLCGNLSPMDDRAGVGERTARARKLAGLSQRQLAEKAHVSLSLLRKVEQSDRPASSAFVAAVARALGRTTDALYGRPYEPTTQTEAAVHAAIPAIRRELIVYQLPPEDGLHPRPLAELAAAVAVASRLRHLVDLTRLAHLLPGLLNELRAAAYTFTGAEQQRMFGLLAEAYAAAEQVCYKVGYGDLSSMTVDRYIWAAERSGDHLAVLVGAWLRAGEMICAADWTTALPYLDAQRRTIADEAERGTDPATLAVWGMLHLKSALAAARAGHRDTADTFLAEARQTAARIGVDRDDYRLCFGPTNVAIWSVALAVEGCDGTTAVSRADNIHLPSSTPRERVGHHWIDVGRGWLLHGDRTRAFEALARARVITPEQTRYHPMVHETIRALMHAERRRSDKLAAYARWAGVTV